MSAVLGVEPEVLSGEEEARLSFTGATAELAGRVAAPYLVPTSAAARPSSCSAMPGAAQLGRAWPTPR